MNDGSEEHRPSRALCSEGLAYRARRNTDEEVRFLNREPRMLDVSLRGGEQLGAPTSSLHCGESLARSGAPPQKNAGSLCPEGFAYRTQRDTDDEVPPLLRASCTASYAWKNTPPSGAPMPSPIVNALAP